MPFYAHLKGNGQVKAVTQLSGEVGGAVEIESLDLSLLGAYYIDGQFEQLILTADKTQITADGIDKAIITANMPSIFQTANFRDRYGSLIASVPVSDGIATLEVTASAPGDIIVQVENKAIKVVAA